MGFSRRLLMALVVLAVGATTIQAVLGYWSFRSAIDRDLREDVRKYAQMVATAIDLSGPYPTLNPSKLPLAREYQGRFRLMQAEDLMFEAGGRFPEGDPAWVVYSLPHQGYTIEVAINEGAHHQALNGYLNTLWISLTLSFLIAIALAMILRNLLLRPLRALEGATHSLARERNPTPLPVVGNDELGRLTQSFNHMSERVHRTFERERSFTRYASHELRTPISALKSHVEAAQLGLIPADEALGVAGRNLEHMERVLAGLLKLAKGVGKASVIQLSDFAHEIIESLSPLDQQRVRLELEEGQLVFPHEALEGAVRNLLENALRYSEGMVDLCIESSSRSITVRDYGGGVPDEVLDRLGQPFFRWHTAVEGTGLGLAFTRQIAETMGGQLLLRNHPNGGLEVRLVLLGDPHA